MIHNYTDNKNRHIMFKVQDIVGIEWTYDNGNTPTSVATVHIMLNSGHTIDMGMTIIDLRNIVKLWGNVGLESDLYNRRN
jgi:hypothetical protein